MRTLPASHFLLRDCYYTLGHWVASHFLLFGGEPPASHLLLLGTWVGIVCGSTILDEDPASHFLLLDRYAALPGSCYHTFEYWVASHLLLFGRLYIGS